MWMYGLIQVFSKILSSRVCTCMSVTPADTQTNTHTHSQLEYIRCVSSVPDGWDVCTVCVCSGTGLTSVLFVLTRPARWIPMIYYSVCRIRV